MASFSIDQQFVDHELHTLRRLLDDVRYFDRSVSRVSLWWSPTPTIGSGLDKMAALRLVFLCFSGHRSHAKVVTVTKYSNQIS